MKNINPQKQFLTGVFGLIACFAFLTMPVESVAGSKAAIIKAKNVYQAAVLSKNTTAIKNTYIVLRRTRGF